MCLERSIENSMHYLFFKWCIFYMVSANNIFFILPKNNKRHHKNSPSQNQRQTERRSLIMVSSFQTLAQTLRSLVHSHDLRSSEQK